MRFGCFRFCFNGPLDELGCVTGENIHAIDSPGRKLALAENAAQQEMSFGGLRSFFDEKYDAYPSSKRYDDDIGCYVSSIIKYVFNFNLA